MKEYDLIAVGTGSAMNIVSAIMERDPDKKVAVIDKDEPGGICLTRGCIPSKLLIYPADVIRTIESSGRFGIDANIINKDFKAVVGRMREHVDKEIDMIRRGLSRSNDLDYYSEPASFVAPYTLEVGGRRIKGDMILLCTGSKPLIPPIQGLEDTGYLTSSSVLHLSELPRSLVIVGGGYIAAEYGHFFSAMGSKVTIIGRNPQFLKGEEPEVSNLALRKLNEYLRVVTNHEIRRVERTDDDMIKLVADHNATGKLESLKTEKILIATGRASNSDILTPEQGGIETDERGWIRTDEYLETTQANVWAFGDATGRHMFKHVANYEAAVVFYNAVQKRNVKADYHAIPSAVFTYPEIAHVGMKEAEAAEAYGEKAISIGIQRYQDTAKGQAMDVEDCFVKVIVENASHRILGAHIIGPEASVLIQEVIDLMYTREKTATPVVKGMHIHPALPEVVERAFNTLMPPEHYHHVMNEHYGLSTEIKG